MNTYSQTEKKLLLNIAFDSIAHGLDHQQMMSVDLCQYPKNLQVHRASFVTLYLDNELRGCIGSLKAYQSLVKDVAHNAYAAAFSDPRFFPLTRAEFSKIKIHISVLGEPIVLQFDSEEDLISQLRPNIDGLILTEQGQKGTFLPAVWDTLSDPREFFMHLKQKAGLPADYWSETMIVERYTVELISSDVDKAG